MDEPLADLKGTQPPLLYVPYQSSLLRAPTRPLIQVPANFVDFRTPVYGYRDIGEADADLTRQHLAPPIGERIIVSGRVLDEGGRPVPEILIEIWQSNAAGRYIHSRDNHPAPIDPNFTGAGRVITDRDGRYRFVTIKPGAYPWRNHLNAWRPAHIHFSLFAASFESRLVTQMYFPGDPLFAHDPIFQSVPSVRARESMVSQFDLTLTEPEWALGYRFDIILRGPGAATFEGRT